MEAKSLYLANTVIVLVLALGVTYVSGVRAASSLGLSAVIAFAAFLFAKFGAPTVRRRIPELWFRRLVFGLAVVASVIVTWYRLSHPEVPGSETALLPVLGCLALLYFELFIRYEPIGQGALAHQKS